VEAEAPAVTTVREAAAVSKTDATTSSSHNKRGRKGITRVRNPITKRNLRINLFAVIVAVVSAAVEVVAMQIVTTRVARARVVS